MLDMIGCGRQSVFLSLVHFISPACIFFIPKKDEAREIKMTAVWSSCVAFIFIFLTA